MTTFPESNPLVTLSNPSKALWIIELHNGEDSRLTRRLIQEAFMPALDMVEREWREERRASNGKLGGAVIICGKRSQDKFFSNGLDYENAMKDPQFPRLLNSMMARLLTFPLPVIAAINGHAFAGGFMLALCADYRVMTDGKTRRAWACMNEISFGAAWPHSFAASLRAKITDPSVRRQVALEGHRFTPDELLAHKIIDAVSGGGTEGVLSVAKTLAVKVAPLAESGVWGLIKAEIYHEALEACTKSVAAVTPVMEDAAAKARL